MRPSLETPLTLKQMAGPFPNFSKSGNGRQASLRVFGARALSPFSICQITRAPFSTLEDLVGPPSIDALVGTVAVYTDGSAISRAGSFCGGFGVHFPSLPLLDFAGLLLGPLQSAQRAELRGGLQSTGTLPSKKSGGF